MPLTVTSPAEGLLRTPPVKRWAICWKIERTDGTVFRFTSHDQALVLADGGTYTPVEAVSVEAARRELDGGDHSTAARGVISTSVITSADLMAGLFRGAAVTEMLVDWLYPWAGSLSESTYWIQDLEFDGEVWTTQVAGLETIASRTAGDVYSRDCGANLGDSRCGVTKASFTSSGTVASVTDAQRAFTTGLTEADGYFDAGELTWLTGGNAGVTSIVKTHENASGAIELQVQTPAQIQAGDTFSVVAGCDKTAATCKTKFSNLDNFRGFPFIPGTDRAYEYP